jgi:aquaporin Z
MESDAVRRFAAEFVGAFALIFVGVGSIMVSTQSGLVGVALAHGLAIGVMFAAVSQVSGGHFNPAVTFGFLVTRRISPLNAAIHWAAQLSGAVTAALMLRVVFPDAADLSGGVPTLNSGMSTFGGLVLEAILTFFLVWVIFGVAADPKSTHRPIAGLAIGLTITLDILIGGPLTGAAVNPARAFGPQLVESVWSDGWIYYVGPLAGAAAAALLYDLLYLRKVPRTA